MDTFLVFDQDKTLTVLILLIYVACDLTFLTFDFDPLTKGHVQRSPWTIFNVDPDQQVDSVSFVI